MTFPILSTIIFLPLLGALFIFISNKKNESSSAIYISIFTSMANLLLTFFLWYSFDNSFSGFQFIEEKNWISGLIKFKLGIDGISKFIKFISNKAIQFQSGYIYDYAFVMLIGLSALITYLILN